MSRSRPLAPTKSCWTEWPLFNHNRIGLNSQTRSPSLVAGALEAWLSTREQNGQKPGFAIRGGSAGRLASSTRDNDKSGVTKLPPDTAWMIKPQGSCFGESPSSGLPPVCDTDLDFLIDFAAKRGAELLPELREQINAAVAAGQSPKASRLRALCREGNPPLKGDDDKGDTPDPRIFTSFGTLSPPAWAALDYSLSLMEIFCPRPSPEKTLLPVSAAVSITTFYDHCGTADGCVGEAKDYTAGIYAFLPFLPSEAPGPAGMDLLLDQTAMTAFGRQPSHAGAFDADKFMHARLVDGAVMGFNAILTAIGCSSLPCDEQGWWTRSCPFTRAVLEAYMITNDLVDFVSDCTHAEPMNLYRNPLLAGAPLPVHVEHWLKLGPSILDCHCGATDQIHSDLFHTWVGAMTYNMITPRCRFARTVAWHSRVTPPGDDRRATTCSFPKKFRPYVYALILAAGLSEACADRISHSSAPLVELAASCTLELGCELLSLFNNCAKDGPADDVVSKKASSIYYDWRSLSWGPGGRRIEAYHRALKRDLVLLACSAYIGGTFLAMDAYVRRIKADVDKLPDGDKEK